MISGDDPQTGKGFLMLVVFAEDQSGKSIVLCTNNDGPGSGSFKTLDKTFEKFYNNSVGYTVYPSTKGDNFSDVLQKAGPQGVWSVLEEIGIPLTLAA